MEFIIFRQILYTQFAFTYLIFLYLFFLILLFQKQIYEAAVELCASLNPSLFFLGSNVLLGDLFYSK
jgi:hypothetical protein